MLMGREKLMGISRIKEYNVSPSAFEAHAGEGSRRKPYDNIFTSNGVSLHELAMKISKDMERSEHETDDLCREPDDGGDISHAKSALGHFNQLAWTQSADSRFSWTLHRPRE